MKRTRMAIAGAVLLVAACGSGGATSGAMHASATPAVATQAARQLLLSAVARTASEPVRIDATLSGTLSGTGSVAVLGNMPVGVKMHFDVESASNLAGQISMTLAGWTLEVPIVVANGIEFVSPDNGVTWKTVPGGTSPASINAPILYLQSADTVSDLGPREANGRPAEEYHAVLDVAKMSALLSNIAGVAGFSNPAFAPILNKISFTDGQVNVFVDGDGNLTFASGYADATVDASEVRTGLSGRATIHASIVCTFTNYGAPIMVTPPPTS
jgi:hypothetical protein